MFVILLSLSCASQCPFAFVSIFVAMMKQNNNQTQVSLKILGWIKCIFAVATMLIAGCINMP